MMLKSTWEKFNGNSLIEGYEKRVSPKCSFREAKVAGWGAMDLWIITGIFLLGVGVGAASTGALQVRKIRRLKKLLEYAHNNPRFDDGKSDERISS